MAKAAILKRVVSAVAKAEQSAAPDRELLRRFAADGDQAAFAALVRRHTGLVLGVCRRSLPTAADAEDACQAVFVILARKAAKQRWQPSIANWLFTTARKVARDARLAAARRARREGAAAVPEAVAAVDQMTARELLVTLDEELDRLSPIYREPLVLCYLEGLTRDDVAQRLGVPAGTVKIRLERARKKLADALTGRGVALGSGLLTLAATSAAGASPPLIETILAAAGGSPSPAVAALAQGVAMKTWVNGAALALGAILGLGLAAIGKAGRGATDKPARAKETTPAPPPAAREGGTAVVTGTVLGTDGKPAAGVKLLRPVNKTHSPTSEADITLDEVGRTDDAGRFRVALTSKSPREYLIAHLPGYGIDWVELDVPAKEVSLRLVPDVPIRGRVLTTEGKPAAGVSVSVVSVYFPAGGKLDDYLAAWKADLRQAVATPRKRLYSPLGRVTGSVRTDADGRFTLSGVGGERIVHLVAEGAGTARQNPMVITQAGFDPKPYNDLLLQKQYEYLRVLNRFRGLNGPDLTLVAEPGKTIEGAMTDAASGQPVAGVVVSTLTGWGDGVSVRTGADGRYRLEGIPKQSTGYGVSVRPQGAGYLAASASAPDTVGYAPVRLDVKLTKGVVVTGRVTDKQTGKGVRAGVRLAPLQGNKFFGPGADSYSRDRTMRSTDADGRFRLTTIPGRSLLMVQAQEGEKFNGEHLNPYRRAVPDPEHKGLFKYDAADDSWRITAVDNSLEFLDTEHAARVLDLKETVQTTADVTVDRGRTGRVEVQDADGKPLAGAFVAGLTDSWPVTYRLPEAAATVYALNPATPRTLAAYHPAKRLGGVATIRGDEEEPVVLRLSPVAAVTGRLVDEFGAAVTGAEVTVNAPLRVFSELYRFTTKVRPRTVTDAAGKFSLPAVVPGMEFSLQIRKGEQFFGGKPRFGRLNLKAGETMTLGDRTVERLR